jgi:glycine/D-amino acid oxidase-like deaminating enzyme
MIGGGIVGSLVAYQLAKKGLSVVVLERDAIGLGSTSASTALILYELDESLTDLQKKLGKEKREQTRFKSAYT